MTGKEILEKFGYYMENEPVSIYPFSPVYRIHDIVVKRTQKRPQPLVNYTTYLYKEGINVVVPVKLKMDNPQTIGDETFVVYPFISGKDYAGKDREIYEAGRLLGNIHHLSPAENVFQLGMYDVYDFTIDEVVESVKNIDKHAKHNDFKLNTELLHRRLIQIVSQQEVLQHASLPMVMTPHDYKANNLIYTPAPYLIDPDNAVWIPRIFDLALALLLFHNEMETAPDQVFTPKQWALFLKGYQEYISLSALELQCWKRAIEHVFLDEVMWLMAEVKEDWKRTSQRKLFASLLALLEDKSAYKLG
ncbi:phosphotransferase [Oceanobacillus sp. FSL K6-2867]|uniref:phosphotransferase n=1 Tax=Oceanobacillus sp. FSL K6-2867 TaxID=2954748 RepID=UPI0030DBFFA5